MIAGRVELRQLSCSGRHGDTGDGGAEQHFFVDVTIELDLSPVALSDAYADVVDLADLARTVREVIGGTPRLLLETVAVHVVRQVLELYPTVRQVRLRLARPDPPGLGAAEEAVEVTLDR